MFVCWGAFTLTHFTVVNGVKQGGITSPILFNVYMDDLSIALTLSDPGYFRQQTIRGVGGGRECFERLQIDFKYIKRRKIVL